MCEEKKDYGATLNLPKTEFPMRGNLPENEPKILEGVFEKGLYENIVSLSDSTEQYYVGPYYFNYHRGNGDEQDWIVIGKHDERNHTGKTGGIQAGQPLWHQIEGKRGIYPFD